MEFEVTSLWNRETFCIFALEFKDPMAAQSNIAKSHFSDAFFSKSSDGNPWSDILFCARRKRKTTFPFTGKERDRETSFSYFGARYYDCDLSGLFLSVDPMADKYPNLSPYAYCAWNPVTLVDPIGMDTTYYNLKGKQLFTKAGGENVIMMVLTNQTKMDEKTFKLENCYSFDLATLDICALDDMYDYSDKSGMECYYAIRKDGSPTERQYGNEKNVPDTLFDAENWQYNVHTHCMSDLIHKPNNITNNTEPSIEKDRVGIGEKFGIILGYTRRNMDVGYSGGTFSNGGSLTKPNFRYKREISFYDSKGRIGESIPYEDFKKTIRKIKTGK